jgi:hypothetical protein
MKRIISILTISFVAFQLAFGQNEFDLFKFVQPEINGTARYTSMAGAFGALGGDPSAIGDNPGGLGIYRSSEISGSLNLNIQETQTQWLKGSTSTEGLYLPHFAIFNLLISDELIPISHSINILSTSSRQTECVYLCFSK